MNAESVVKVDGAMIRYGKLTAVNDLSLSVPKKSVYALLGRNGSGKSSTVRSMLGQRRLSGGEISILGLDSWRERRRIMEHVGVVPENPDVPRESNADAIARFMVRVAPRWSSQQFFERLSGLGVSRKSRFDRLSKGQQRHFALALALAGNPKVLILDDPTLGLDVVAKRALYEELVGDLADRGTTVFLTTHDLAGVEAIADRVGVLDHGTLLVDESLESLKARFCRLFWTGAEGVEKAKIEAALRHLEPISVELLGGTGEAVVGGFSEVGFGRFRDEAPVNVMRVDSLSLEDVFVVLCGGNGDCS